MNQSNGVGSIRSYARYRPRSSAMNLPTWLDERGRPHAKRRCPTCGGEIPVVTLPLELLKGQVAAVSGVGRGRVVRPPRRGNPGTDRGRAVAVDSNTGRGEVKVLGFSQGVWWYPVGGVLGWLAVIFLWRRSGDVEWAADLVCRAVAGLGWWLGYAVAGFWLLSFALSAVLGCSPSSL